MPSVITYPGVFDGVYSPIVFSRASSGTYFNSAGVLTTAATNAPRIDYNPSTLVKLGMLIEEARTNSIRNNTMVGAVAGTPGTLPTNWGVNGLGTLTRQVVGTGTVNGITYIDLRFSGTTSSTQVGIRLEPVNGAAGTNGQTFTFSAWVARVAGSTSNIGDISANANIYDAGFVFLATTSFSGYPITAPTSLSRVSGTGTIASASAAFIQPQIYINFSSGVAIDITLRIGLPQAELGAFATSVIPTTTAAVTRSADAASVDTLSPWYNATEGTLYAEYVYSTTGIANQCAFSLDDLTNANTIVMATAAPSIDRPISSTAGVGQLTAGLSNYTFTAGQTIKRAIGYKLNDFGTSVNGGAAATDNTYNVPTISRLTIGAAGYFTQSRINGYLRRVAYYPTRLTNAQLQALTA